MVNPLAKRVNIDIGLTRPISPKSIPPKIIVFGIVPMDYPVISEIAPQVMIQRSPTGYNEPYVEQVRLSSASQQALLPSISGRHPSKLRDTFRTILATGCKEVDFVLARSPTLKAWDVSEMEAAEMFIPFLNSTPDSICLFPDAGGPWPRSIKQYVPQEVLDVRLTRQINMTRIYGQYLLDNFQFGMMDLVMPPVSQLQNYLRALQGGDFAACLWSGEHKSLLKHGWRSPCAAIGGLLASNDHLLVTSSIGNNIPIGNGRKVVESRAVLLGAPKEVPVNPDIDDNCVVLRLDPESDIAQVHSEMTFRRPMFQWPIPALRTMKKIHMALTRAAELFVFRPVQQPEAIALQTSIESVLDPFYKAGVLVGPDGTSKPRVSGTAIPSRTKPMLSVDLSAQVKPWCQSISLKVMVKSGSQPQIIEV